MPTILFFTLNHHARRRHVSSRANQLQMNCTATHVQLHQSLFAIDNVFILVVNKSKSRVLYAGAIISPFN